MVDRDRQLLQLPSSFRERATIGALVVTLMVGLGYVTWNLVEGQERGLTDVRNVKIASISDAKQINSNVTQQSDADDQVRIDCQRHPFAKELSYKGAPVTDEGLKYLGRLKHLVNLSLSGTNVTDEGLGRITQLPLQLLFIDGTQVGDTGVMIISRMKTLTKLDLGDTAVTSNGVCLLKQLPDLESLNISGDKVHDDGLKCLAEIKKLSELDLESSEITEDGLHFLAKLPALQVLKMGKIKLTVVGAKALSSFPAVRELDLQDSDLTDQGLKEICSTKTLRRLNLNITKITDNGLAYLRNLPRLKDVVIENCPGVTEAGIAKVAPLMPGVSIKHNRPWRQLSGEELLGKFLDRNRDPDHRKQRRKANPSPAE